MKKGKNIQFGKIIPYMVFTKNVGAGVKSQRIGEHNCFQKCMQGNKQLQLTLWIIAGKVLEMLERF